MNLMFWRRKDRSSGAGKPDRSAPAADLGTAPTIPRGMAVLLSFGGAAAAIFGLWALQGVAAPVFLALVLTICAHPVRGALERIRVPRGVATILAILLVFALLAGFVAALLIALTQFTTLLPQFTPQPALTTTRGKRS